MLNFILTPLKETIRLDSTPERLVLFEKYAKKNRAAMFAEKLFRATRGNILGDTYLAGFTILSAMRISCPKEYSDRSTLSAWGQVNEKKEAEKISEWVPELNLQYVSKSVRNIFSFNSLAYFLNLLKGKKKRSFFRLIRRLSVKYEFVTVCRALELLAYLLRLSHDLESKPPRAVLVAGPTGSEAQALLWAAKKNRIKTIYSSRAFCPPKPENSRPIYADLALLEGESSFHNYSLVSPKDFTPVFKGVDGVWNPMTLELSDSSSLTIGVFLGKSFSGEAVKSLISSIQSKLKPQRILVRPHPVRLFDNDFQSFLLNTNIEISVEGRPIEEDLESCDLVIAGNSNSHLQILKYGVPSVYLSGLDRVTEDLYGFVEGGILYELNNPEDLDLKNLSNFYGREWKEIFSKFDGSYGLKQTDVVKNVRLSLVKFLES